MTRSRWHAAPLPTERDEDFIGTDTDSASSIGELGTSDYSQGSQGTVGSLTALQETTGDSVPPPPPMLYDPTGFRNSSIRRIRNLTRLLWICVPAAALLGLAFGFLLGRVLS